MIEESIQVDIKCIDDEAAKMLDQNADNFFEILKERIPSGLQAATLPPTPGLGSIDPATWSMVIDILSTPAAAAAAGSAITIFATEFVQWLKTFRTPYTITIGKNKVELPKSLPPEQERELVQKVHELLSEDIDV